MKCQAGWLTSCNQDCLEKYEQPQIYRWCHSNGRSWIGSKEPFDEGEKAGLNIKIQKTKIMASSLIISWQIEVGKVEAATDFIFLGSKITSDSDFINEIKRHLLLGSKAMTTLHSILKSTYVTFPTKVCVIKAMVFPVCMDVRIGP